MTDTGRGEVLASGQRGEFVPGPRHRARVHVLVLTECGKPPSLNQLYGRHWTDKDQIVRVWRTAAWLKSREVGRTIPRIHRPVIVAALPLCGPRSQKTDAGNTYPATKAVVDGLRDDPRSGRVGVIAGDEGDLVEAIVELAPIRARTDGLIVGLAEVDACGLPPFDDLVATVYRAGHEVR